MLMGGLAPLVIIALAVILWFFWRRKEEQPIGPPDRPASDYADGLPRETRHREPR